MGLAPVELEGASEAAEDESQLSAADEADDERRQEDEPELSTGAHDDEDAAPLRAPSVATWVGPAPSDPDSQRGDHSQSPLPQDENDPEWLDLSTRWLIATGPHAEEEGSDDSEVTNEMHWADHLAAGVRLRAESQSSAPPPPMAAVPQRHAAPTYPRAAEAPAARQRAASGARHPTLAGISPLPEDRASWPAPADPFASDGLRGANPSTEQQPWRDEPSYKERPRHHTPRQSWAPLPHAPVHAAPVGTLPPWAAMSMYAPPPTAAMPQPYATGWNAPHLAPPPWVAAPGFGNALPQPQFYPTGAYPAVERRPSQSIEYTAPRRPTGSTASERMPRRETTQPQASGVTLEQWKNLANSWLGAVGKLAIAAMALHYSGLAVPLLGQLGYTPASTAPITPTSAGEPVAPSLAAASVIADPTRPALAAPRPDGSARRGDREADTGAADHAASTSSRWRRAGGTREVSESSSATRRRSARATHKNKPETAHPAVAANAPEADQKRPDLVEHDDQQEQEQAQPAAPSRTTEQLMAAAIGADAAAGEAFLRINSRPWSQVFIDGTLVGTTPKIDLRVSAGPHRVRLVNPELGLSKTFQVDASAGQTIAHVEHLDE